MAEACTSGKPVIEPKCETKRVPLDPTMLDETIMMAQELTSEEEMELLLFLDKIATSSLGRHLTSWE
jgi:hypothetical protein